MLVTPSPTWMVRASSYLKQGGHCESCPVQERFANKRLKTRFIILPPSGDKVAQNTVPISKMLNKWLTQVQRIMQEMTPNGIKTPAGPAKDILVKAPHPPPTHLRNSATFRGRPNPCVPSPMATATSPDTTRAFHSACLTFSTCTVYSASRGNLYRLTSRRHSAHKGEAKTERRGGEHSRK